MAMSDRVAVMNKGRIEQIDRPETIFNAASNEFVHTFVGESSCLSVLVGSGAIRDSGGIPLDLTLADPLAEGAHRIYLRPTHIRLGSAARNMPNKLSATLSFVEFLGETRRFHLRAGTSELIADQTDMPEVGPGESLEIGWESSVMRVFR
jgi:ABC-type sugar transport system ATPase subunit